MVPGLLFSIQQLSYMKKLFFILAILLYSQSNLWAQNHTPNLDKGTFPNSTPATILLDSPVIEKVSFGVPIIKFKEIVHEFGNVRQNVPAECVFEFTNTGTDIIALESVKASCGCTTPDWNTNPVAAGQTGTITAKYNSVAAGSFSKGITVTFSNGTVEYLTIKGNVETAPYVPTTPIVIPDN